MTALEHIYAIKNILSRGPSSDDFHYSDRLILHYLTVVRAKLIKEKADKYQTISDLSYQSYCMDLSISEYHDCCSTQTGCKVLKTVLPVPSTLHSKSGTLLKVTTLNGVVIPQISKTSNDLSTYSSTMQNKVGYDIVNGHIIIFNNLNLEKILVTAIFADPDINTVCSSESEEACSTYLQDNFPIDADLIGALYQIVVQFLTMPVIPDIENDAKSNSSTEG